MSKVRMFNLESTVEKIGTSETFRGNQSSTYKAGGGGGEGGGGRDGRWAVCSRMYMYIYIYADSVVV